MILKKLEALANRLDKLKLTKEADLADSILSSLVKAAGGLPHDDDDEEAFENYLANLDSREYVGDEEEEAGDMSSDELQLQLDAITKMLADDRMSDSEKDMLAGVLQSLRLELGNDQQGWGMGGSVVGETVLPMAEASKK